jgi:sugar lactone lactonase YvrE
MRRACVLLAALALASCGPLDQRGVILPLEDGWAAEVVATERDGFGSPDGLLWKDNVLYIADEGGHAVRAWRPGSRPATLADAHAGLASPEDLVRDPQGNLYFSDDTRGGVWRIDAAGRTSALASPENGLPSTEGIGLTPGGDILVGDGRNHRVMRVTRDGRVSVFLGPDRGIAKPESFAFDSKGNLYIADNEQDVLYVLTPDGVLHRAIEKREGFSPESLHFAGGQLLITDSHHGKLFRYTPEDGLSVVALLAGELGNVQGIAADDAGNLFLSVQSDLKASKGFILRLYRKAPRS